MARQNAKVPQEFWSSYIVEKLRKDNPHINLCYDESQFVKGGAVVYIPQAGTSPGVVKNRDTFPATVSKRKDSAILYALDDFSTNPTHMPWAEGMEISYDKMDSVLRDHVATLSEAVGDEMIYNWVRGFKPTTSGGTTAEFLPVSRQIATSGDATAVNPDDGQTGTRKALHYKDLQKAQAKMNKDGVPKLNRYAMLESNMLQEFIDSLSSNQMAAFQASVDLKNGIVGTFAGFTILERSSVLAFNATTNEPIVPGQALSGTDNLGCLLWQKDCVTKAEGDIELFQDLGNPIYYGDIYSGIVKVGGRCRREDWKGVLAIVQKA